MTNALISKSQIEEASSRMARSLVERHGLELEGVTLLVSLRGAFWFASDLLRTLDVGVDVDFIGVSSYEARMPGDMILWCSPSMDLRRRTVVLVEDIIDTGRTVSFIREYCVSVGADAFSVVTLLDKPSGRCVEVNDCVVDVGFTLGTNDFVVGHGLDDDGRDRGYGGIYICQPIESKTSGS